MNTKVITGLMLMTILNLRYCLVAATTTTDTTDLFEGSSAVEPEAEQQKGWVVFASVVVILLLIAGQFVYYPFLKNIDKCCCNYHYHAWQITAAIVVFVLGLTFLLSFWLWLYPSVIQYYTWLPTNITTESLEENPYRCCNIVNCECTEYHGSDSCTSLVNQLVEGSCGNGYDCCNYVTYSCGCHKSGSATVCSTCSYCSRSVSDERCDVVCGTCYSPKVTVSYIDEVGEQQIATATTSCSRDEHSCVTDFFGEYGGSVGYTAEGFFNPFDNNEFQYEELEISEAALGFTNFIAFLLLCFLAAIVGTIAYWLGVKAYRFFKPLLFPTTKPRSKKDIESGSYYPSTNNSKQTTPGYRKETTTSSSSGSSPDSSSDSDGAEEDNDSYSPSPVKLSSFSSSSSTKTASSPDTSSPKYHVSSSSSSGSSNSSSSSSSSSSDSSSSSSSS